jgi:hypothetical protein
MTHGETLGQAWKAGGLRLQTAETIVAQSGA